MVGELDNKDKAESRKTAVALMVLVAALVIVAVFMLPMLMEMAALHLSPGLSLKSAALISFFITVVIMIVFAVASGDGFLGEIQFILAGFFLFFLIIWLLLAWIF